MTRTRWITNRRCIAGIAAFLVSLAFADGARAGGTLAVFSDWWLNPDYSEHGKAIDTIFYFTFWLTTVIMVVVEIVLVWFLFKYRHQQGRKSVYSHGNTKLEMIWTLIPAIILIVLAMWTKQVWDNYRYSPLANDPNRLQVLVIGEQFKWDVVYPGPSGKIGRYLIYPKTTDLKWPTVPPGKSYNFPNVPGPAYLPEDQARGYLNKYIAEINPLGRDYSDPDTDPLPPADRARYSELLGRKDLSGDEEKEKAALEKIESLNDYSNANGRPIVIPKGRAIEFLIGSRDVVHDFFLPNFRERLDAVPGMKGKLYLKATRTSKEFQPTPRAYALAELEPLLAPTREWIAVIDENSPGNKEHYVSRRKHADYWRYADKDGNTIIANGFPITADTIKDLRAAGVQSIVASSPFSWDVVCEELCGVGHANMQGKLIVVDEQDLSSKDYQYYFPRTPAVASAGP